MEQLRKQIEQDLIGLKLADDLIISSIEIDEANTYYRLTIFATNIITGLIISDHCYILKNSPDNYFICITYDDKLINICVTYCIKDTGYYKHVLYNPKTRELEMFCA